LLSALLSHRSTSSPAKHASLRSVMPARREQQRNQQTGEANDETARRASAGLAADDRGRRLMTGPARGAQVELKNVRKYHGSVRAVDDISLTVRAGEFFTLLGPSGSGKTTTLTLIAGFDRADSGQILIGDREVTAVPAYARDLGFVFQNYAL